MGNNYHSGEFRLGQDVNFDTVSKLAECLSDAGGGFSHDMEMQGETLHYKVVSWSQNGERFLDCLQSFAAEAWIETVESEDSGNQWTEVRGPSRVPIARLELQLLQQKINALEKKRDTLLGECGLSVSQIRKEVAFLDKKRKQSLKEKAIQRTLSQPS